MSERAKEALSTNPAGEVEADVALRGLPSRLRQVKTVVVKVGSSTLGDASSGLKLPVLYGLAAQLADLRARGLRVVLVSSGAILAGRSILGIRERPATLPKKQACAAVGQIELMARWRDALHVYGIPAAQVLLTAEDLGARERFLNARHTLLELLEQGCLPVINENDTVATQEIRLGDNDQLASLILNLVDAELLVLLSDVDGLYTANPTVDPSARRIPVLKGEAALPNLGTADSSVGTGGMGTKLEAARRALLAGAPAVIARGIDPNVLPRLLEGEPIGTWFLPVRKSLNRRKQWLAFAGRPRGSLTLDEGAVQAVLFRNTSLLPRGIVAVTGKFEPGDLVILLDPGGEEIARGLSHYSSTEVAQIRGLHSEAVDRVLGKRGYDEVVHRDQLVIRARRS